MNVEVARKVEQVILRFWRDLDRRDYTAMIASLTADCRWLREGWIEGHAAIAESLMRRPGDLLTRHLITNIVIDAQGGDLIASHLVTTFAGQAMTNAAPLPAAAPVLIADVELTLVQAEGQWRISRIEPTIMFR